MPAYVKAFGFALILLSRIRTVPYWLTWRECRWRPGRWARACRSWSSSAAGQAGSQTALSHEHNDRAVKPQCYWSVTFWTYQSTVYRPHNFTNTFNSSIRKNVSPRKCPENIQGAKPWRISILSKRSSDFLNLGALPVTPFRLFSTILMRTKFILSVVVWQADNIWAGEFPAAKYLLKSSLCVSSTLDVLG